MHRDNLELLAQEEYAIAAPFFSDLDIYCPILHAILEKKSAGRIFTDDRSNPAFVLVCSPSVDANLNAPAYLGGSLDETSVDQVLSYLITLPKVSLMSTLNQELAPCFEKAGFKRAERLQLRRRSDCFHLAPFEKLISSQYSVDRIKNDNFSQCNWYAYVHSLYGNEGCFFKNGMGFCLVDQGKIAAESYGFLASHRAELGVITDKNYRSQNLGTIISAFMLDYCCKNNIDPYWNCDLHNPASAAIAKKLGFEEDCRYFFLKWLSPEKGG